MTLLISRALSAPWPMNPSWVMAPGAINPAQSLFREQAKLVYECGSRFLFPLQLSLYLSVCMAVERAARPLISLALVPITEIFMRCRQFRRKKVHYGTWWALLENRHGYQRDSIGYSSVFSLLFFVKNDTDSRHILNIVRVHSCFSLASLN